MESEYMVAGMTCEHCVRAVSTELEKLPGVSTVEVDLATGRVRVRSDGQLEPESVRAALDEAGYELAGA
jgi:copper chaperone CopZ